MVESQGLKRALSFSRPQFMHALVWPDISYLSVSKFVGTRGPGAAEYHILVNNIKKSAQVG